MCVDLYVVCGTLLVWLLGIELCCLLRFAWWLIACCCMVDVVAFVVVGCSFCWLISVGFGLLFCCGCCWWVVYLLLCSVLGAVNNVVYFNSLFKIKIRCGLF